MDCREEELESSRVEESKGIRVQWFKGARLEEGRGGRVRKWESTGKCERKVWEGSTREEGSKIVQVRYSQKRREFVGLGSCKARFSHQVQDNGLCIPKAGMDKRVAGDGPIEEAPGNKGKHRRWHSYTFAALNGDGQHERQ